MALILSLTISILCQYLFDVKIYQWYPKLMIVLSGIVFLIGPFLYLYIHQMTTGNVPSFLSVFHFLPFVVYTIFLFSIIWSVPAEVLTREFEVSYQSAYPDKGLSWYAWVKMVHLFSYGVACIFLVSGYKIALEKNFSNIDQVRLRWLQFLIYAYTFLIFIPPLKIFLDYFSIRFITNIDEILTLYITIWIFAIAFYWMHMPHIVIHHLNTQAKEKYSTSSLTKEKSRFLLVHLQKFMKEQKPYLNPDLALSDLASQLNVRPHYLSQVINGKLGYRFFDFVNHYRIEEVKQMIQNNDNSSFALLGLAFEAGFNNKVSFNKAFKKFTGLTPSKFRMSLQKNK
ncbi:MAG: AraC family transcriptional regulator [Calditrichaceae bacterium]|nr:AraC family transcriptional regulator [Calditrichaceae bacterium]MBN2709971.1 AraC family transcriptional regulator [Calditrichaceae bacterium]